MQKASPTTQKLNVLKANLCSIDDASSNTLTTLQEIPTRTSQASTTDAIAILHDDDDDE